MARPQVGNLLTIFAALAYYFLCMILPLVGPAAMHGSGSPGAGPAPHLKQNIMAFSAVLLAGLVFSGLALYSKLTRRRIDSSPIPKYSIALCVFGVLMLLGLITGAFSW